MNFKCKGCTKSQVHRIQDRIFYYCPLRHQYPSPRFIEAWGCDDYESSQLDLFKENENGDKKE